jgi:hypothetical protein
VAPFLFSTLAAIFLPTGCNTPGWSFCVRMPPDVPMEITQDEDTSAVYNFAMPDGSSAHVRIDPETDAVRGGTWSVRRQGLENVRWQADGHGRIDYFIERVWAESAGIPRFIHAWIEASETGEISDAEALILTLRSCDPGMCPATNLSTTLPVAPTPAPPEPPEPSDPVDSADDNPDQPEAEIVAETGTSNGDAATPPVEAASIAGNVEIPISPSETIVEVVRVPFPSDAEEMPPETDDGIDALAGSFSETPPETDSAPDTADDTAPVEQSHRDGPVMLTGDN